MGYRTCVVRVTNYDLKVKLATKEDSHVVLKIKCYSEEERRSFKFIFPSGDKRVLQFLAIIKAESTDELYDKKFQLLFWKNHIYGISKIGKMEEVKYIPATPCEYKGMKTLNQLMSFEALKSFITESVRTGRPYFIELQ